MTLLSVPVGWAAALVGAVAVIGHVVVCALALGVLPQNRKPSTAMAWLILILAAPYLGVLAFALFGSTSVGRSRRAWQDRVNDEIFAAASAPHQCLASRPGTRDRSDAQLEEQPPPREGELDGLARLNQNLAALPLVPGNTVDLFDGYRQSIAVMTSEVARARRFVHAQFYIAAWDEVTESFFEALAAAADRGVEVRFLFDHLGSRGIPGFKAFIGRLEATKIRWAPMLPIGLRTRQLRRPDLRNHRKLLVIDGRVGFIGSQNMIEPGYDKPSNHRRGLSWVELTARVTGPVVGQLGVVFATDWTAETEEDVRHTLGRPRQSNEVAAPGARSDAVPDVPCQVVPSGPGFATENNLRLFNSMLYAARRHVSLVSPYFVPDETLLYAVTTAADRGVDVELFVSAVKDQFTVFHAQRSFYSALLDAGVRIWLYPEPYVLHAKFFTVDDSLAVVGSSNMDYRSFALNYECVLYVPHPGVVQQLHALQDRYRSLSQPLDPAEWAARGWRAAYVDNVMRLTATLQ